MKKIHLLIVLLFSAYVVQAQLPERANPRRHDAVDPRKDFKDIQGYTIRLRPAFANTYLFDILQNGKPLKSTGPNIIHASPEGYRSKEEAFRVAEWTLEQYQKEGKLPRSLPPQVAAQLRVHPKRSPR